MGGRIRWALFTALVSVVLATALGVAALCYRDEETEAGANPPLAGNYVFAATTLHLAVATLTNGSTELVVTGGRLSIGADGHVFWSLAMHSARDAARTGRLSCDGSLDRTTRAVVPSPRYGYNDFAPDLDRRELQTMISNLFCQGAGLEGRDSRPVELAFEAGLLVLKGSAGSISWRRE